MADVTAKLGSKETQAAIAAAVAATLTPEAMRAVMTSTLAAMLEPKSYAGNRNAFQDIFEAAIKERTRALVDEIIAQPGPIRDELDKLTREALERTLSTPERREEIVKNTAAAIAKALSGNRF